MNERYEKIFKPLQNGSDVRGSAIATEKEPRNLTPEIAADIAAGFLVWLEKRTGKPASELRVGVGHDSRLTADIIKKGILSGLSGVRVYDCGLASTPSLFISTILEESAFDGAIMITASHLPFNRNGMKFFTKDGGLEKSDITEILMTAAKKDISVSEMVSAESFDLVSAYSRRMMAIIKEEVNANDYNHPLKDLHIVVDAGNGASGFFASRILEPLGADISGSIYLEPDGSFPNHVPNPENPAAMAAISKAVISSGADLGVIFDCDGDRGAVVFSDGSEVNRNTLIALMAAILKEKNPGATVVTDSVTSDELTVFLEKDLGMTHLRFKRGYKNVINKGSELNAAGINCPLAIETSGHGALKENYFSDDGAYLCVKIICKAAQLCAEGRSIKDLISTLGAPAESTEIRYPIKGGNFADYGKKVLEDFTALAEKDPRFHIVSPNYEGIRISFDDEEVQGWMLIRMSLHDPVIAINMESRTACGTKIILDRLNTFLAEHDRLEL